MHRWTNRLVVPLVLFVGGLMLGLLGGASMIDTPTIQASTQPASNDWLPRTITMLTAAGMVSSAFLFLGRRIWQVASEWQGMTARVDASAESVGQVHRIVSDLTDTMGEQNQTLSSIEHRVTLIEANCVQHRGHV